MKTNSNIQKGYFSTPGQIALRKENVWKVGDFYVHLTPFLGRCAKTVKDPRYVLEQEDYDFSQKKTVKFPYLVAMMTENEHWLLQQANSSSCGPTCIAMLLMDQGFHDLEVLQGFVDYQYKMKSDAELHEWFGVFKKDHKGLRTHFLTRWVTLNKFNIYTYIASLKNWDYPVIVNNGSHYVIVDGPVGGGSFFLVRDPMPGWQIYVKRQELAKFILSGLSGSTPPVMVFQVTRPTQRNKKSLSWVEDSK